MVLDNADRHGSRSQTDMSISAKIGCTPHTLHDCLSNRRLPELIGKISSAEVNFYAALETDDMAA